MHMASTMPSAIRQAAQRVFGHTAEMIVGVACVAVLLGCNLCARTRYSVEKNAGVRDYGMPFPYRIEATPYYLNGFCGPLDQPSPWVSFNIVALAGDVAIAALALAATVAAVFALRRVMRLLRRFRTAAVIVVAGIATVVVLWALVAMKTVYERQRVVLAEVTEQSDTFFDFPMPDMLMSAVRRMGGWWFSEKQVNEFLDATLGSVVFLEGPPKMLSYVERLPSLRVLEIYDEDHELESHWFNTRLSPKTAPRLERIRIEIEDVTDVRNILDLPRLRFVTIVGWPNLESFQALNNLRNLEYLDLSRCTVPEGGELQFDRLANLRAFGSASCSDSSLGDIAQLPCLEHLRLHNNSCLTDEGVTKLQDSTSLRTLDLGGCKRIGDASMKALSRLTGLRSLSVSECSITDAGLRTLASLSELEELDLSNTRLTAEGLFALAAFSHLTTLYLGGTSADDRIDDVVRRLKRLEQLDLHGDKITDQGVAGFRELERLRSLGLSDTKITDRCVDDLLAMESLSEILLDGTAITSDAAFRLRGLPKLQRLKVYRCPAITPAKLQELMPRVDIRDVIEVGGVGVLPEETGRRTGPEG
jgi:hypothetical protein